MAVADGMGGAGRGELASRLAIRDAWDLAGPDHELGDEAPRSQFQRADRTRRRLRLHDAAGLRPRARDAIPNFCNSGTTWTSAYLVSCVRDYRPDRRLAQLPLARRHLSADHHRPHHRAGVHRGRRRARDRRQVQPHAHPLPALRRAQRSARRLSRSPAAGRPVAAVHRRPHRHGQRQRHRRVHRRVGHRPGACDALVSLALERRRQRQRHGRAGAAKSR